MGKSWKVLTSRSLTGWNVVDEWDSTKEAHVTEKLKTGKIYTLRETVAPDGYLLTSDTTLF